MILPFNLLSEWPEVWVTVLAHSLWVGALLAVAVAVLLRRISCERPDLRCGVAYSAMVFTVMGALIATAFFPTQQILPPVEGQIRRAAATKTSSGPLESKPVAKVDAPLAESSQSLLARATSTSELSPPSRSVSWQRLIVGFWLTGVAVMMLRLGRSHIAANRLVQRSSKNSSKELARLLDEVARTLQVTKQVSLRVSEEVVSPLIYGVVNSTVLMPASFIAGVPADTLRAVLAHELWHLRRGDLIWGHGQRLLESLLFYHPAIWWLSRQVDCEREAACDQAAASVTGHRKVAEALLDAAEHGIREQTVAFAFADKQLPQRVHRLMNLKSQPRLRVWWGGFFGMAIIGLIAVAGLTAGTGLISQEVATALTPSERLEAIETAVAVAEEGTRPRRDPTTGRIADDVPRHQVTGRFVAEEGKQLPPRSGVRIKYPGMSTGASIGRDLVFKKELPAGVPFYVTPTVKGFARTRFGPFKAIDGPLDLGELRLSRGFESKLRVTDAEGNPLEGVRIDSATLWVRWDSGGASGSGIGELEKLVSNDDGVITLSQLTELPVDLTLEKPGFQRFRREQAFEPGGTVTWQLKPSQPLSVVFRDKDDQPIADVEVYCVSSDDDSLRDSSDPRGDYLARLDGRDSGGGPPVGVTDAEGRIELLSLVDDATYWFMALHPGHAPSLINAVKTSDPPRTISMAPPLEVRGKITGNIDELLKRREWCRLFCDNSVIIAGSWHSYSRPIRMDETGRFTIRQLFPGSVDITIGKHSIRRKLTETIDDLVIDLDELEQRQERAFRTVRLRLELPDGLPVRGVAQMIWSVPEGHELGRRQRNLMLEVPDEEPVIEFRAPIGAKLTLADWALIGAMPHGQFNQQRLGTVPPGEGAYERTVQLRPTGLVTGQVVDSNGSPLPNSRVSVRSVKHHFNEADDELSDTARFAIGKLPLDEEATYVAEARVDGTWRLTTSKPFKITESKPIHDTTLVVPDPIYLTGKVLQHNGKPASGRRISMSRSVQSHSHSAGGVDPLDEEGRFRIAINPRDEADKYTIRIESGGGSTGITLKYKPNYWGRGRNFGTVTVGSAGTIRGQVVTPDGSPLVNVKVEASHLDWDQAIYRKSHYVETDNEGGFLISGVELQPYKLRIDFGKRKVLSTMPKLKQSSDILGNPTLVIDPSQESRELRIVVSEERQ